MNYTSEDFQKDFNVSRETLDKLFLYESLLKKWQRKINLVSPGTLAEVWQRHFLDSAQLLKYIRDPGAKLADLGSGAGFPGLVLAVLGCNNVTLVESDQRKSAFLKDVIRQTGIHCTVMTGRIEEQNITADIITARALKDLLQLLGYAAPCVSKDSRLLFLKGEKWREEITEARKIYNFDYKNHTSLSDESGVVMEIKNLSVSRET